MFEEKYLELQIKACILIKLRPTLKRIKAERVGG